MVTLRPPDSFHYSAALGWLELGNHLEANEELEKITPKFRAHPDVLNVRYAIYAAAKKWNEADTIAQTLVEQIPTEPGHWINLAYATRRKTNGSIIEAKGIFEKAASIFPAAPIIFYNLACYESQLGDLPKAKQWLDRALDCGDKKTIQRMILDDPDLEPLRKHYSL